MYKLIIAFRMCVCMRPMMTISIFKLVMLYNRMTTPILFFVVYSTDQYIKYWCIAVLLKYVPLGKNMFLCACEILIRKNLNDTIIHLKKTTTFNLGTCKSLTLFLFVLEL